MFQLKYPREHYLAQAAAIRPVLHFGRIEPQALVTPVADAKAYQKVRMEYVGAAKELDKRTLNIHDVVILDFGQVAVGYFHFQGDSIHGFNNTPFRLKFLFGEFPSEISLRNEPYRGTLTRAWIQEEIVTVENMWQEIRLPRRYSMRYVAIEVLDMPSPDTLLLKDIWFETVSAVPTLPPAPASLAEEWKAIDGKCLATLRNSMQRFYEDGPKRDRRLWGGDFRFAAKTNSLTFRRFDMTEYVLDLMAGLYRDNGMIASCISDEPRPNAPGETIDFNLLFAVTLDEYYADTGNEELVRELYPLAKRQFELFRPNIQNNYLAADAPGWFFIDHVLELDRTLPMQGLYIYCLRHLAEIAEKLGIAGDAREQRAEADAMGAEALRRQYDARCQLFVSGKDRQISLHSQVWMVLAGVVRDVEARELLARACNTAGVISVASPYAMSFYLEACELCGDWEALKTGIRSYWGGMVERGADTFWEVYRPGDDFFAPYHDIRLNTACHGWAALPAYYFRKLDIFLKGR